MELKVTVLEAAAKHVGQVLTVNVTSIGLVDCSRRGTMAKAEGWADYQGLTRTVTMYQRKDGTTDMHLENGRSKMYFSKVSAR